MTEPLFQAMAYMVEQPALGAIPCLFLLALYHFSRTRLVLAVSSLWALYIPYEFAMKQRILCTGECNIRLDLVAIYPLLAFLSAVATAAGAWALLKLRRSA